MDCVPRLASTDDPVLVSQIARIQVCATNTQLSVKVLKTTGFNMGDLYSMVLSEFSHINQTKQHMVEGKNHWDVVRCTRNLGRG
jgi:hypothetical protein